ncbi:Acid phosphatase [Penicillium ucsense]|uniref:Acid phosphatase n=1 Tax=Penicillium ucsense TaxID=2839758 RepID=A0A8J8W9D4_9EURO|nr:Acid phosphatase [Penicillium ucsense]KAF7735093.1 Acid phosphatase [Penicillium ucsense]
MTLKNFIPLIALLLLSSCARAINIISSNDDGWAEVNIRSLFDSLSTAGHSVVVVAPAENQSGTGSSQKRPTPLAEPCQFSSCPAGSPAIGHNASQPRLNYVNSFPVTAMKYGIHSIGPRFHAGSPDLAVAGPNVGNNIGLTVLLSGTVGAAAYAAHDAGIPAIAFSGASGSQTAWNATPSYPHYSKLYAQLATMLVNQVTRSGKPYLPQDVWLNVNFPAVSDKCNTTSDFSFVLSRIHVAIPFITPADVVSCGKSRLPNEIAVSLASGCYVSVSVGMAGTKDDADAVLQGIVRKNLMPLLSCLP